AEQFDVIGLAGKEGPVLPDMMESGVLREFFARIFFRLDSDGIDEDGVFDLLLPELLRLHQMRNNGGACGGAVDVHEVEDHNLVFEQVAVEEYALAVVGGERDIGEMLLPHEFAAGDGRGEALS